MLEWCSNVTWPLWRWRLVPLFCIVLCKTMCILKSRTSGRRFCCWGGINSSDLEEMRKEIAEPERIP